MKDLLIEKLYEITKKPYQKWFKKGVAWETSIQDLIAMQPNSLGFHLGCFLIKYNFEMQPKLEYHDVFHVLTNTGITVQEEIAMQYFLLGNGKRSAYLFSVIAIGTCFYPTYFKKFKTNYYRGKKSHRIYDLEFQKMLLQPLQLMQQTFNIF